MLWIHESIFVDSLTTMLAKVYRIVSSQHTEDVLNPSRITPIQANESETYLVSLD